eukprot:gene30534-37771_t
MEAAQETVHIAEENLEIVSENFGPSITNLSNVVSEDLHILSEAAKGAANFAAEALNGTVETDSFLSDDPTSSTVSSSVADRPPASNRISDRSALLPDGRQSKDGGEGGDGHHLTYAQVAAPHAVEPHIDMCTPTAATNTTKEGPKGGVKHHEKQHGGAEHVVADKGNYHETQHETNRDKHEKHHHHSDAKHK